METTRRTFLTGVAAAVLTVPAGALAPARARTAPAPAGVLRRSRFVPLVGSAFTMTGPSWSARAVLCEVASLPPSSGPQDEDRFSLLFRCPPGVPGEQAVYRLRHARLGAVDVLAVPVGDGRRYEVVVNRI